MLKEIEKKFKRIFENIIDNSNMKIIDSMTILLMIIVSIITGYLFISTLAIIKTPIIQTHSALLYSAIFVVTVGLFYFSMLGNKTNKPSNRPKVFFYMNVILALNTYSLLAEIFNYTITSYINSLLEVTAVPTFLIHTNVRLITVFLPILIVALVFSKSFIIPFNKIYKAELLEYQVDSLTRNVDKITDTTVDIKICEDIETGKDVLVSEKITFGHTLLNGSTGSGKTALSIRPELAQLFYMKAKFREKLKELTFQALEEGLCYINKPITNKFFNDNFSMEYISVYDEKKKEFIKKFKDYIIGVRDNKRRLYSEKFTFKGKKPLQIEIPIRFHSDIKVLMANVTIYVKNMINEEIEIDLIKNTITNNKREQFVINTERKLYSKIKKVKTDEKDKEGNPIYDDEIEYFEKELGEGTNKNRYSEYVEVTITPLADSYSSFSFNIDVDEEGDGKIIYRDLGVTVVAPDGGLAKDTVEIAQSNGIYVHKIDPKMDEISKGNIAKINPLLVGAPEKAADIVSSILIAMEQTSGKDSNPYFTNASIRAVRNVIILLKVMYPMLHNGDNPILSDALDILNNFNLVTPYVKKMKEDTYLRVRWKSVIDYFESCFYPPNVDESGRQILGSNIGSKTKKTEEAITGIINQLDNFLGREEIKYIFCDRKESLNFSEVLEKGECIAISTRQSELGDVLGKAFALMIILSIQNAVLGRYSEDENPEIPYHIKIDEFPFYVNDATEVFFTFARKYKCAVTAAIQNLAQLEKVSKIFREVIFANCTTKIVLPGANVEDRQYFCDYFGIEEQFEISTSVTSNPVISENAKYSESSRGQVKDTNKVSTQKLAELKFKRCYYSTVDQKGNKIVGKGYMDFLKLTQHNTLLPKNYDFEKFNSLLNSIENHCDNEVENHNNDKQSIVINNSNSLISEINDNIDNTKELEELLKNNMVNFQNEEGELLHEEIMNISDNNEVSLNLDDNGDFSNISELNLSEDIEKDVIENVVSEVNSSSCSSNNNNTINIDDEPLQKYDILNIDDANEILNIDDVVKVKADESINENGSAKDNNSFEYDASIDISAITMIGLNNKE